MPSSSQLPFNRISEKEGISPTAPLVTHEAPAGTSVVVRLQSPLSSAKMHAGDLFDAVLEEPIAIQEGTLAEPGALLQGRVVAAEAAHGSRTCGYLRLTLVAITINGRWLSLKTSSMFAKGELKRPGQRQPPDGNLIAAGEARTIPDSESGPDVTFSTGRRVVFRLAEPLVVHG